MGGWHDDDEGKQIVNECIECLWNQIHDTVEPLLKVTSVLRTLCYVPNMLF